MVRVVRWRACWAFALVACTACRAATTRPIALDVDAADAPRHVFHARLSIPVEPGALTLVFPKWLPGTHAPSGAINALTGLQFTADGKSVAWRRDAVDMYAFHCDVPAGVDALEVRLDFLSPVVDAAPFTVKFTSAATENLAVINWESVLLYPLGRRPEELIYAVKLRLPAGWQHASALVDEKSSTDAIEFKPVSLVTLIDSPLLAGKHFRKVPLSGDQGPPCELDICADSDAALEIKPETSQAYKKLVAQAGELFGCRHYRQYRFLLTLSDPLEDGGWEHHESSDDRAREQYLVDADSRLSGASLLPHEYAHSWNGKFRRPVGLATPDYQQPMKDDLLWVYEGLTEYLGEVLSGRCGLRNAEQCRESVALVAAGLENRPGRKWRPLADTAVAASLLYDAPSEGAAWRRGVDFYDEGVLIWLEADVIIRQQTGGKQSLDDFCRAFFGGPELPPSVKTYTMDDVVAALNDITPYDWRGFFERRIYQIAEKVPLGGIEGGGWKLVYNDTPNEVGKAAESADKSLDLTCSLGLSIGENGRISDVIPGTPADKAGLAPGFAIIAVNGRKYSDDLIREAVKRSKDAAGPIELIAQNGEFIKVHRLDYHGGARYPHLERDSTRDDLLTPIFMAKKATPGADNAVREFHP